MSAKPIPNQKKAALRKDVEKNLAEMTLDEMADQSKNIINKLLNHPKYKSSKRIALFLSLPNEVNTAPILEDILQRGSIPFVPQYSRGQMKMLRVMSGDLENMVATSWGIKQHSLNENRENALEKGLDLVIAPGAAFTKEGWRCGHGGGYYDRYLNTLIKKHEEDPNFTKPYIIAIGFSQQVYSKIPIDPQDVKVDEVIVG